MGRGIKTWEWGAILLPIAATVLICQVLGVGAVWQDLIVYTVIVFATVAVFTRSLWIRASFWRDLALLLALHTLAVAVLSQSLPAWKYGIPKFFFVPAAITEGVLIFGLLWRRNRPSSFTKRS